MIENHPRRTGPGRPSNIPCLVLLFVTGGVILALEVLASRIMSPYFGVSLYIWAGILSITLISLAFGYYLGGIISERSDEERLRSILLFLPALASIGIFVSRLIYPGVFPRIAHFSLITGSFAACVILLAIPLILLSAMNPILIAIHHTKKRSDSRAGMIFFISTMGSVTGVIVTAFALIPNIPNSKGILILGWVLGTATLVTTFFSPPLRRLNKTFILVTAAVGTILCAGAYFLTSNTHDPTSYVIAEIPSFFSAIKVVDMHTQSRLSPKRRLYTTHGANQSIMDAETGLSLTEYNYTLINTALAIKPHARSALVLGLAGGLMPRMLHEKGLEVQAVDIDPKSVEVAKRFFHFDPVAVPVYIEDARTYVRQCERKYDLIFIDIFNSGNMPDYLMTREFFLDLADCLTQDGIAAINSVQIKTSSGPLKLLQSTIMSVFPHLITLDDPYGKTGDAVSVALFASNNKLPHQLTVDLSNVPPLLKNRISKATAKIRHIDKTSLKGIAPATDDCNSVAVVYAKTLIDIRRLIVKSSPGELLLN